MEENNQINGNLTDIKEAIHQAYEGLESKESYTIEEAANILLRSPMAVKQAVRRGELHGLIVDHHIVSISREAILDWLRTRPKLE